MIYLSSNGCSFIGRVLALLLRGWQENKELTPGQFVLVTVTGIMMHNE